jgi:hypothetical protein
VSEFIWRQGGHFLSKDKSVKLWPSHRKEVGWLWEIGWAGPIEEVTVKIQYAYSSQDFHLDEQTELLNWSLFKIKELISKSLSM